MQNGPERALMVSTVISKVFHRQLLGGAATATKKANTAK